MPKIHKALISGSLVLLVTFGIYNILNFLFQFSMARALSVSDYGILAALYSIIYLASFFTESIQTMAAKYASEEKNQGKIRNLLKRTMKKSLKISTLIFLAYLILIIPFTYLL